jgi:hypothetical protein
MNIRDATLLAKSTALLEKTRQKILEIDDSQFPSDGSKEVRNILLKCVDALVVAPEKWEPSPIAYYRMVFKIRGFVNKLERSSDKLISWPVVSYCNKIWTTLLGQQNYIVFFSHDSEHNYSIYCFSNALALQLRSVIPPSEISNIISNKIYCISLASMEEENLPIYANIGHEIGHILFTVHAEKLNDIFLNKTQDTIIKDIIADIDNLKLNNEHKKRLKLKSLATLDGFVKEITSDLFGAILFGPNFIYSLGEMSWEHDMGAWDICLSPEIKHTRAYPSFTFRLQLIRKYLNISEELILAKKEFSYLSIHKLNSAIISTH